MAGHGIAVLMAILAWWFSTGVILLVCALPRRTFGWSLTAASLIAGGAIAAATPFVEDQVQPASLDLRLGSRAWRVRASFLPGQGRKVSGRLADVAMHELDLERGAVLERGCVYLAEVQERLARVRAAGGNLGGGRGHWGPSSWGAGWRACKSPEP